MNKENNSRFSTPKHAKGTPRRAATSLNKAHLLRLRNDNIPFPRDLIFEREKPIERNLIVTGFLPNSKDTVLETLRSTGFTLIR